MNLGMLAQGSLLGTEANVSWEAYPCLLNIRQYKLFDELDVKHEAGHEKIMLCGPVIFFSGWIYIYILMEF